MNSSERLENLRASINQSRRLAWFCFAGAISVGLFAGNLGSTVVAIALLWYAGHLHRISTVLPLSSKQLDHLEPYLNVSLPVFDWQKFLRRFGAPSARSSDTPISEPLTLAKMPD
jgi:hypothetical protein